MRAFAVRFALVIASTLVAVIAIEGLMRLSGYSPVPQVFVSYTGRDRIERPFADVRYVYPANLVFTQYWPDNPRGYFAAEDNGLEYRTNNFGFRGEDFQIERSDKLRIAFLGDSFCWGTGVRREDTLASRTEQILDRTSGIGTPVEVYNFGLPGLNTRNEAALYEHVARHFQPDLLVVLYFLNDVNLPPERYFKPGPEWAPGLKRYSLLADLVVSGFNRHVNHVKLVNRVTEAYDEGHPGITSVEAALNRIRRINVDLDVPTFLAVFPWLVKLDEHYPFALCHERVGLIAEGNGFYFLDLLPVFQGRRESSLWVHKSDHHPNELGHHLAANAIADLLAQFIRDNRESISDAQELRRARPTIIRYPEPGEPWPSVFSTEARGTDNAGISGSISR